MKKLFQPSQILITYWEEVDLCTASTTTDGEFDTKDIYDDKSWWQA